jgi:hypothetical protein
MKLLLSILCLLASAIATDASAQETTREQGGGSTSKTVKEENYRVLLIPFKPTMYMSEVDKKIGTQQKMTFDQVRDAFRWGLDSKLLSQMRAANSTYSLLSDSAKNRKDLEMIYKAISYSYDKVTPDGSIAKTSPPAKDQPRIKDGHLVVEMSDEAKFMNTKIDNPKLLPYLHEKYKTDYFVFINELDIRNNMDSYDIATDTYQRVVTVHYTIFDKTGKKLNAGIATSAFSSNVNDTKTIINTAFASIARSLNERVVKAIPAATTTVDPLKQK